jgi:hypothetical protein
VVENTEGLTKLEECNYLSGPFICCTIHLLFLFICSTTYVLFLFSVIIQEFKDKVIVDAHAAKSQIQGSKKTMVTSTNISSQPKSSRATESSNESKNKNSSK